MDVFDYLSVLFSVVLGLALTQILQGFRALMLARSRLTVYWPALIWSVLLIFILAGAWWGMFAMHTFREWTFGMYAMVVVQITLMYLVAALAVPDIPADGPVDMSQLYFSHAGWFFTLFALTVLATFAKDFVTTGGISSLANAGLLGGFFVMSLVAAVTRSRWFHGVFVLASVAAIAVYSAFVSGRI